MATVFIQKRERKNRNSYVVYYKDPATLKLKYFKTFQRQKEAQQAGQDLRALIDTGRAAQVQRAKAKPSMLTFAEVSEQLGYAWAERVEKNELRPKTCQDYLYILNQLVGIFGRRLLSEISAADILNYRASVASGLSNVTSNRNLFVLKQVFKEGLKLRTVFDDPAASIKYLSEKEHERNKFLLPLDLDRLVDASRQGRAKFYLPALIYLGAEHGASKQEALSLIWPDINFGYENRGMIKFFRTKNTKERTEYLMRTLRSGLSI